jgi:hypothetical protein
MKSLKFIQITAADGFVDLRQSEVCFARSNIENQQKTKKSVLMSLVVYLTAALQSNL